MLTSESKERKDKILKLRLTGMTYREIAAETGVSFQYVAMVCAGLNDNAATHFNPGKKYSIYEGIDKWLHQNEITYAKLIRIMGKKEHFSTRAAWSEKLMGKRCLFKEDIDYLLDLTGLSYEDAFRVVM